MSNQYQQYSTVKKYWHLMRPHTLTVFVVPVLVGTAASKTYFLGSEDHIKISLFTAMLLICLLIQAVANMSNRYYDYKKGLDDHKLIDAGGAIACNGMSPELTLRLAIAPYILATISSLFLAVNSSFQLLSVGLVCMAVGYLCTDGPFPISWTPFGELFSGAFMGVFIIVIAFLTQTGNIQSYVIWSGVPIVITIGLINMANNIHDCVKDKVNGRKTLSILLGKNTSLTFMATMYFIAYASTVFTIIIKPGGPLFYLPALLSFPMPIKIIRHFKKNDAPPTMMSAMAAVGKANTFSGLLYILGIYISALLVGI